MTFIETHDQGTSNGEPMRDRLLHGLTMTFPANDPISLHETFTKLQDHENYQMILSKFSSSWRHGMVSPKAVVDGLLQLDAGKVQTDLLNKAIGGWASEDPKGAFQFLMSQPKESRVAWEQKALMNFCSFATSDQVVAFVTELEIDELPPEFVSEFAQRQSEVAAGLLRNLKEGSQSNLAYEAYARTLAEIKGETGLDWLETTIPNHGPDAMKGFTQGRLSHDPLAVSEWLAEQPQSPSRDVGIESLANHLIETDPEAAFSWAASIGDDQKRFDTLINAIPSWATEQPNAVRAAISELDVSEELKGTLHNLIDSPSP